MKMVECERSHLRIEERCVTGEADPGRGAKIAVRVARCDDASADSRARAIATTDYYRRPHLQAGCIARLECNFADDVGRGVNIWQNCGVQTDRFN